MKQALLAMVLLITSVDKSDAKVTCKSMLETIEKSIVEVNRYADRKVDLDITFSKVTGDELIQLSKLIFSQTNLKSPVFLDDEKDIEIIIEENKIDYSFENYKIFVKTYQLDEYNKFEDGDEIYYPKDLLKLEGYFDAISSMSHSDLFNKMFSSKAIMRDCSQYDSIGEFAHIMESKLEYSLKFKKWYNIKGCKSEFIISLDEKQNTVNVRHFDKLANKFINIYIEHSNKIDMSSFQNWLYSIQVQFN